MTEEHSLGFSESWLELREPADHAARNNTVQDKLGQWCRQHENLNVVELGAGTGSNLRYLMPGLGHGQHWLLLDNDARLLEHLPHALQSWADAHDATVSKRPSHIDVQHAGFSATITTQVQDLASQLDQLDRQILHDTHLLTGSALLDLTSAAWLTKLAAIVNAHPCACLFVLNYNGSIQWQPTSESDATISNLLNLHQLGDKGFGPALGPQAGNYFARQLQQLGRQVFIGNSDWQIGESSVALQQAIIEGWAPAAIEQDADAAKQALAWLSQRQAWIDQGVSRLNVGHCDVLTFPEEAGRE